MLSMSQDQHEQPRACTDNVQLTARVNKRAFPQAILATVDAAWQHRLWHFGKICA